MTGHSDKQSARAMVHARRHSCASRLAEDGATATEIQALLGREALNRSQGYIEATANQTAKPLGPNRMYQTLGRLHLVTTRP